MTLSAYQPQVIRRYNLLAYVLAYLIGLIIVLSTISLHFAEAILTTTITLIVFQIISLLLPPILSPGG